MVINIGALKQGKYNVIEKEIRKVVDASDGNCVKVIIEACLLNNDEKILAARIARDSGADYIKTSTGFSISGATIEDVALLKKFVGDEMGVKASGGIKTKEAAISFIEAGANRIGSSSGVDIVL